ncbi:C40 family peptidase [Desulfosporosinus sp. Sb-LF]|uniref:C40 family peptidase n=1 Tax=Desulfosporosinus sp. Sb-LF TaxID=2560027 RepID=UPI00107EF598|nr:C40 family peptidase [Desulfosporosinus sp. Sb-LF]TGE31165.1 hydrolase [Desulfosporosinus sp. Sb-LF]
MKNIMNMKCNQWFLLLAPVISAFLFVTIVTAAPPTVTCDSNIKEKQVAMTAELQTTVSSNATIVNSSAPVTNNVPQSVSAQANSGSTPKSAPVKQVVTKETSRSSTASTAPKSTSQPAKASAIINTAKQYTGVNYLFGGTTPSGFDCSGFVQYVFAKNGTNLPRVSRDQFKVGTPVSFSNLQPGDLVFFSLAKNGVVDHEGIYVGNGQFINAASSKGVTIYTLGSYWQSAYIGARRVL